MSVCPCGNGCRATHDSRSYGPASCVVCQDDMSDDHAFNGGKVCFDCISREVAISGQTEVKNPDLLVDPPNFDRVLLSRSLMIPDEGEYDLENELFKSQIQHIIDSNDLNILEVLEGWTPVHCPHCSSEVTFDRDGEGVLTSCDECRVGADLEYVL